MATTASTSVLLNFIWRLLGGLGVLLLFFTTNVFAGQVTLTWDASPGPDLKGYRLYYGQASRQNTPYPSFVDVGLGDKTTADGTACTKNASGVVTCATTPTLLKDGTTYYFGVVAYNSAGVLSGFSNEIYQNVGSSTTPPTAGFSASPTSGAAPLAVTFADTSTGAPTNWCWTFGASTNFCDSTAKNPSYTYTQAGTYQVTLTAGNAGGSNMAKSVSVTVSPQATAPVAGFNASPTSGTAPLAVTFTNTSSNATAWSWDFGDGGTSNLKDPSHTFQTAKIYTVTLIAKNSAGSSTPATKTITVNAPTTTAPVANFTANPVSGDATPTLSVTLTDTSTGTNIAKRTWSFGDGNSTTVTTAQNFVRSYAYGTYTVSLSLQDSANKVLSTKSQTITAKVVPPAADFSATPTATPLQMQFSDSSKGTVNQWAWQFGDGGTSTAQNPAYTYKAASTYTVTLKATGPTGVTSTTSKSITVSPAASTGGLVAAYNFEEASGTTAFDASGQNNHGTITEATYTSGKYGNALNFDGVNDWVTIKDVAALDLTKGMTLEAWVYPTATMSGWRSVLLKEQAGGLAYGLYANSDSNKPVGSINVGGDKNLAGTSALAANTWTHLAVTYDGATQRLYVNGTQVAERAQTGSLTVSDRVLRIGGNSVWGEFFKGRIDEVRVYNRALKAEEIQADMNTAGGRLLGRQQTSSYTDTISQYTVKAFQQKADKAGKVTNLSVYVTSGSTALVAGLYSDSNGRPGTLLAQGRLSSPKAGTWNAVPVPATAITAGTYWIAILSPGGILQVSNQVGGGSEPSITSPTPTTTLPSPSWWTSGGTPYYDGPLAGYGTGY